MKFSLYKHSKYRLLLFSLLVSAFIVAQSLASSHASTHMFHASDSSCFVLSSAENHSHNINPGLIVQRDDGIAIVLDELIKYPVNPKLLTAYQTRAPPFPVTDYSMP